MKYTNRYPIIALPAIFCLLSSCSQNTTMSLWHNDIMDNNKSSQELTSPLRFYDAKSRLQYTVLNDDQNLYLCIMANDDQNQLKIMRSGIQVWIDPSGKNKKEFGIIYPVTDQDARTRPQSDTKTGNFKDRNSYHNQYLLTHEDMMLKGFKAPLDGIVPKENKFGLAVNLLWDSLGNLVYKERIPFSILNRDSLSAGKPSKKIGITIVVPPLSRNMNPEKGDSRSGRVGSYSGEGMRGGGMGGGLRGGGMGGGMRGGGMGGGMRGGGHQMMEGNSSGNRMSLMEASTIKLKVNLAVKHSSK